MPPPPVASSVIRRPSKRRATPSSESAKTSDYEDVSMPSTSRSTSKCVPKKPKLHNLSIMTEDLGTDSPSGILQQQNASGTDSTKSSYASCGDGNSASFETTGDSYESTKSSYSSCNDGNSSDLETTAECTPRSSTLLRQKCRSVPPFEPELSPIARIQDNRNLNQTLTNYGGPYRSQFTRRLSAQATTTAPSRSISRSKEYFSIYDFDSRVSSEVVRKVK